MTTYQQKFERLSNEVKDLLVKFLVGKFVAGLKEDLRLEVKVKQPKVLVEVIGIADLLKRSRT